MGQGFREILPLSILSVVIIIMLVERILRERIYAKQIRDLTSKIISKDVYEYRMVMEDKPVVPKKEKQKKIKDPVLGDLY